MTTWEKTLITLEWKDLSNHDMKCRRHTKGSNTLNHMRSRRNAGVVQTDRGDSAVRKNGKAGKADL